MSVRPYLILSLARSAPGAARRLASSPGCLCCSSWSICSTACLKWGVSPEDARPQEILNSLQAGQGLYEDNVCGVVPELSLVGGAGHAQLEGLCQC